MPRKGRQTDVSARTCKGERPTRPLGAKRRGGGAGRPLRAAQVCGKGHGKAGRGRDQRQKRNEVGDQPAQIIKDVHANGNGDDGYRAVKRAQIEGIEQIRSVSDLSAAILTSASMGMKKTPQERVPRGLTMWR